MEFSFDRTKGYFLRNTITEMSWRKPPTNNIELFLQYLTSKAFEKFAFFHSEFPVLFSFLTYSFIPYLITSQALELFTFFIIRQSTKKDALKTRCSLSD